jgi:hypothetical protein
MSGVGEPLDRLSRRPIDSTPRTPLLRSIDQPGSQCVSVEALVTNQLMLERFLSKAS